VITDTEIGDETRVPADALFILIGAAPRTNASEGWLRRDEHGFLMTGPDLFDDDDRSGWPLRRERRLDCDDEAASRSLLLDERPSPRLSTPPYIHDEVEPGQASASGARMSRRENALRIRRQRG